MNHARGKPFFILLFLLCLQETWPIWWERKTILSCDRALKSHNLLWLKISVESWEAQKGENQVSQLWDNGRHTENFLDRPDFEICKETQDLTTSFLSLGNLRLRLWEVALSWVRTPQIIWSSPSLLSQPLEEGEGLPIFIFFLSSYFQPFSFSSFSFLFLTLYWERTSVSLCCQVNAP